MTKKIMLLVFLSLLFMPILAYGAEKTITLEEAINIALKNNPNLESMVKAVRQSEYMHSAASKEWLPTLSMDYNFTYFPKLPMMEDTSTGDKFALADYTSNVLGTHIKMPIYTGGAIQYKETIERLGIDVAKMRFLEAKADLIQEVTINYFNVLKLQSGLEAIKEDLRRYKQHEILTDKYFSVGMVPANSLLEIKAKRADAKQDEVIMQKDLKLAEAALNVAMGINIESHFQLISNFSFGDVNLSLEECFDTAKKSNPSYVAYDYMEKRAKTVMELEKTESRLKVYTDLALYEHGKTPALRGDDLVTNDNIAIQVVGTWNVFDWFKTRERVKAREAELEKLISEKRSASDKIAFDIRESYLNLKAAKEKFEAVKERKMFTDENYRIAKLRYEEKVAKPTEVNDALVLSRQSEFGYYMAAFEYNVALARLERVTGVNLDFKKSTVTKK